MNLFELRGALPPKVKLILEIAGILLLLFVWFLLTLGTEPIVPAGILPSPSKVLNAIGWCLSRMNWSSTYAGHWD